jgi:hypothetical protein
MTVYKYTWIEHAKISLPSIAILSTFDISLVISLSVSDRIHLAQCYLAFENILSCGPVEKLLVLTC